MPEFVISETGFGPRWLEVTLLHPGDIINTGDPGMPDITIAALSMWINVPDMYLIHSDQFPGPLADHKTAKFLLRQGFRRVRKKCMLCPNVVEHVFDYAQENPPEAVLCAKCGGK